MSPEQGDGGGSGGLGRLLALGRRLLAPEKERAPEPEVERRAGKRVSLQLPVDACLEGGKFHESRVLDVSLRGLAVEPAEGAAPGKRVTVRFRSSAGGVPPFMLQGRVVRILARQPEAMGINVRRNENSEEALASFRKLVLYYLRHKPLLNEVDSGYFEGRCVCCDWVGHVGTRNPTCAVCGEPVKPLEGGESDKR